MGVPIRAVAAAIGAGALLLASSPAAAIVVLPPREKTPVADDFNFTIGCGSTAPAGQWTCTAQTVGTAPSPQVLIQVEITWGAGTTTGDIMSVGGEPGTITVPITVDGELQVRSRIYGTGDDWRTDRFPVTVTTTEDLSVSCEERLDSQWWCTADGFISTPSRRDLTFSAINADSAATLVSERTDSRTRRWEFPASVGQRVFVKSRAQTVDWQKSPIVTVGEEPSPTPTPEPEEVVTPAPLMYAFPKVTDLDCPDGWGASWQEWAQAPVCFREAPWDAELEVHVPTFQEQAAETTRYDVRAADLSQRLVEEGAVVTVRSIPSVVLDTQSVYFLDESDVGLDSRDREIVQRVSALAATDPTATVVVAGYGAAADERIDAVNYRLTQAGVAPERIAIVDGRPDRRGSLERVDLAVVNPLLDGPRVG